MSRGIAMDDETSVVEPGLRIHTAVRARATEEAVRQAISLREVNFFYGEKQVLFDVSLDVGENRVTADIEAAVAEDQGRPSFRSRFITKRERNNHEIPLLTGQRTPPRPPW